MANPLNYKGGITHRTPRDRARAHGTRVPPVPSAQGYCTSHGHPHAEGTCQRETDTAHDVAKGGGTEKLPRPPVPFKLGGV